MKDSILRQVEKYAYAIGDKAQWSAAKLHLDIDAFCGRDAWIQCKMDPQIWRALVQYDEEPGKPLALMAIRYGLIWPVQFMPDEKLDVDAIQLRDQKGRVLLDLVCGETVDRAMMGNLMAGE